MITKRVARIMPMGEAVRKVKRESAAAKKLAQAHYEGYKQGREEERLAYTQARQELDATQQRLKLEQVAAVTNLINVTSQNLSKAGYLLGKLNGDGKW